MDIKRTASPRIPFEVFDEEDHSISTADTFAEALEAAQISLEVRFGWCDELLLDVIELEGVKHPVFCLLHPRKQLIEYRIYEYES